MERDNTYEDYNYKYNKSIHIQEGAEMYNHSYGKITKQNFYSSDRSFQNQTQNI